MDIEDQRSEPITEVKFMEVNEPVKIFLKVKSESSKSESSSEGSSSSAVISAEDVDLVYKSPPRFFRSSFIHKTKELFSKNHTDAFEDDSKNPLKAKSVKFGLIMYLKSTLSLSQSDLDRGDDYWLADGLHRRLLYLDAISKRSHSDKHHLERQR